MAPLYYLGLIRTTQPDLATDDQAAACKAYAVEMASASPWVWVWLPSAPGLAGSEAIVASVGRGEPSIMTDTAHAGAGQLDTVVHGQRFGQVAVGVVFFDLPEREA